VAHVAQGLDREPVSGCHGAWQDDGFVRCVDAIEVDFIAPTSCHGRSEHLILIEMKLNGSEPVLHTVSRRMIRFVEHLKISGIRIAND